MPRLQRNRTEVAMSEHKYLIVHGGGVIELVNGNDEWPFGGSLVTQEALSVYRLTYIHGEPLQIEEVKSRMGDTKFTARGK